VPRPLTSITVSSVADGGTDARSNLRALCRECHNRHTSAQNRARRKKRRTTWTLEDRLQTKGARTQPHVKRKGCRMKQEANVRRRFLSATAGVIDLDQLLADQERRKVELEGELSRTQARLASAQQRLQVDEPLTYAQIELAQAFADTRRRNARLKAELVHLNGQLEETRKRIAAFDRGR
jgi:hypothetical protein